MHRRDQTSEYEQNIDVIRNTWHPDYDATGVTENDIAVLELARPIEFSAGVQPVCAPVASRDYAGEVATVSGWGYTSSNSESFIQITLKRK